MGKLTVREERLVDILPDFQALSEQHWREVDFCRPVGYNPNWPELIRQNEIGYSHILVLRAPDGQYAGHLGLIICTSLQTQCLTAYHETFVIHKNWRIGRGAILLLKAADDLCDALGVREIFSIHPSNTTRLLKSRGFRQVGDALYKPGLGGR